MIYLKLSAQANNHAACARRVAEHARLERLLRERGEKVSPFADFDDVCAHWNRVCSPKLGEQR